jgi:hypothetical protein
VQPVARLRSQITLKRTLREIAFPTHATTLLEIGVERSPARGCKRHVIHEDVDAVCSLDRVPQRRIAAGLDGDAVVLCRRGQTLAHSVIGNPVDFKCGDVAAEAYRRL